jgi:hypothetical protein
MRVRRPILVAEGPSETAFAGWLAQRQELTVAKWQPQTKPGLVAQLLPAFRAARAYDPEWVLYTEPDKRQFFRDGLYRLIEASTAPGVRPGLILAARTAQGLRTYPCGQRTAETMMNQMCGEAVGQPGDYTYGPMLIHRSLLGYTEQMPEELGWGWRFFLIALAHQTRRDIALCTVPNECPRAQQAEDDPAARVYRLRQLVENVTGLANGWTFLLEHQDGPVGEVVKAA